MEMKYGFMIPLGVAAVLLLSVCFFLSGRIKNKYKDGVKAANLDLLTEDSYYKRQLVIYRILRVLIMGVILTAVMASFVLLARPYHIRKTKEKMYSRDIIFCLDVSTSVNALNLKLTNELRSTVNQLNGERIGIVIFNTSPVLLVPLTDDYEYVLEQLENIRTAIKMTDSSASFSFKDGWLYWYNYLMGGTLVGNEDRGSSLISDGLLGAAFNFPEAEKKRTRIVILSTDNEPYGTQLTTLTEAAELCARKDIVVYGIGTEEMTSPAKQEMRSAVELTGGKFYLEENASTFRRIVDDIQSHSADLVEGKTYIKEVEDPEQSFYVLVNCLVLMLALSVLLRRVDLWWCARQAVMAGLLLGVFYMVIVPARSAGEASGPNYKADSDLNVLFIVDDTISMLARDYDGGAERLDAVKEDCSKIIDELYGARFSVISFDNDAQIMAPFTGNGEHIKNVIASLYPIRSLYAKGTSLGTVKEPALESLKAVLQDGKKKTAVFFISDGEMTAHAELESFGELSAYIDGGAVLGYGTQQGGEMFVRGAYNEEEEDHIMMPGVWPQQPAVSVIDEKNLKRLAKDMKIAYVNMNADGIQAAGGSTEYPVTGAGLKRDLVPILTSLKERMNTVVTKEPESVEHGTVYEEAEKNPWYGLMIPLIGMLFLETALMIRRRG